MAVIYIISLVVGFVNFVQFDCGKEQFGRFILKSLVAFGFAVGYCMLLYSGFASGQIAFTVLNLLKAYFLLIFHITLGVCVFESGLDVLLDRFASAIFIAVVLSLISRVCFASLF
ncbi:MAG: hypothetical protein J6A29_03685 [Clostridia bacterium]|nr:hypothetical protein [Clostridia bacterium]